jgi:very-short-patch-repair endonuclease
LRGSRFHGAIPGLGPGDRRQVPFDRFVIDFYCHAAKLAIEIDGKQHEWFSEF